MKINKRISTRELRLLSAYLDSELTQNEEKQIARLIKDHPEISTVYKKFHETRAILKLLPPRKVPRNFTLSTKDIKEGEKSALISGLRFASAISALLLCGVLAYDLVSPIRQIDESLEVAQSSAEPFHEEKEFFEIKEEPPIINWYPSIPRGYGIGGGDNAAVAEPIEMIMPDTVDLTGEFLTEEAPSIYEEGIEIEPSMVPQTSEKQGMVESEDSLPDLEIIQNPILGIRPQEEQGTFDAPEEFVKSSTEMVFPFTFRSIEIFLALVSLVALILSNLFKKERK